MHSSLDLTAASRVHLLEPQWNPSLEDQALARVHRIGQEHAVTTIRYVMQDSFEEVFSSLFYLTRPAEGSFLLQFRHN
jgi:SNF2 family DNA or RNA helicase